MSTLKALWHMQGGECLHGIKTCREARDRMATREHLQRKADGGLNVMTNYVLACRGCNARRGREAFARSFRRYAE